MQTRGKNSQFFSFSRTWMTRWQNPERNGCFTQTSWFRMFFHAARKILLCVQINFPTLLYELMCELCVFAEKKIECQIWLLRMARTPKSLFCCLWPTFVTEQCIWQRSPAEPTSCVTIIVAFLRHPRPKGGGVNQNSDIIAGADIHKKRGMATWNTRLVCHPGISSSFCWT